MSKRFLITRPEHDTTTHYLSNMKNNARRGLSLYHENPPKFPAQIKKGVVTGANMLILCLTGIAGAGKKHGLS